MLNMERCLNLFLLSAYMLFVVASLIRGTSTSPSFSDDKAAFNCSVRLETLREAMRNTSATGAPGPLDVYVESSADLFGIGTTAECNARVKYLSGFSGRGGYAAVTSANATIWVNEQYFAQAVREVDSSCWQVVRQGNPGDQSLVDWIAAQMPPGGGGLVGGDPRSFLVGQWGAISDMLTAANHSLVGPETNLVDLVWGSDRPACPSSPLKVLETIYTGRNWTQKVKMISERLDASDIKANVLVIEVLEEVAWLLNLRGKDGPTMPFFYASVILQHPSLNAQLKPKVLLFVNPVRVTTSSVVSEWLGMPSLGATSGEKDGVLVEVRAEESAAAELKTLSANAAVSRVALSLKGSAWMARAVPVNKRVLLSTSPIEIVKAVKTEAEVSGMRRACVNDGMALAVLFAWLEREMNIPYRPPAVKELDVIAKLDEIKRSLFGDEFASASFSTIAGSGPHAAIIHYRATNETNRLLNRSEVFLLDSGSQFPSGTTDVTRTLWLTANTNSGIGGTGPRPPARVRTAFTLVLRGHIQLALSVHPERTLLSRIDVLARSPLWRYGLDYNHGTSHGIGSFLSLHESLGTGNLVENMILSNEPGYYEQDSFGIRIESLVLVTPAATGSLPTAKGVKHEAEAEGDQKGDSEGDAKSEGKATKFLSFETLTLAPIDTRLVDTALLTAEQVRWLNDYNRLVRQKLEPELRRRGLREAFNWLVTRTASIAYSK